MRNKIDIIENEFIENYPRVLDILLLDNTTKNNILWATSNYEHLGEGYKADKQIFEHQITGYNGRVIMPRIEKDLFMQLSRVKNMAEVFTPSWLCNSQNNLIDDNWFKKKGVFNKELVGKKKWVTNQRNITFPKYKTWKDYVQCKRLEICCGEAPYITSRYDTVSGYFIEVNNRIGILDRKLRVINENVQNPLDWIKWTKIAYQNTYAYEWQGDSLLLARESMLFTFIENFEYIFDKNPSIENILEIAKIISWNVWQMDGLKGVIPNSCKEIEIKNINLFGEEEIAISSCNGCLNNNIFEHNGKYALIKDWSKKNTSNSEIRYIDLMQKNESN